MRENRLYGSEGGEAKSLPYPYQRAATRLVDCLVASLLAIPAKSARE